MVACLDTHVCNCGSHAANSRGIFQNWFSIFYSYVHIMIYILGAKDSKGGV